MVKSTLAAETLALVEGAEVSFYIASIIQEVTKLKDVPIHCFVDNKSLVDALSSSKQVEDRRLRVDIAVLDERGFYRDSVLPYTSNKEDWTFGNNYFL